MRVCSGGNGWEEIPLMMQIFKKQQSQLLFKKSLDVLRHPGLEK